MQGKGVDCRQVPVVVPNHLIVFQIPAFDLSVVMRMHVCILCHNSTGHKTRQHYLWPVLLFVIPNCTVMRQCAYGRNPFTYFTIIVQSTCLLHMKRDTDVLTTLPDLWQSRHVRWERASTCQRRGPKFWSPNQCKRSGKLWAEDATWCKTCSTLSAAPVQNHSFPGSTAAHLWLW